MEVPKTIDRYLATIIVIALVLFGVWWRLTSHMPNFAPIGAIALTSGMILGWKKSLVVVVATMAISDLVIGSYSSMQWTWLSLGLIGGLGYMIRKLPLAWRIPVGAFGASGVFFVVSNFGTWISSGMYSLDLSGLVQCYIMALPFLKATLLSDTIFIALFLIAYEKMFQHNVANPLPIVTSRSSP